jgi:hypothetical protein
VGAVPGIAAFEDAAEVLAHGAASGLFDAEPLVEAAPPVPLPPVSHRSRPHCQELRTGV